MVHNRSVIFVMVGGSLSRLDYRGFALRFGKRTNCVRAAADGTLKGLQCERFLIRGGITRWRLHTMATPFRQGAPRLLSVAANCKFRITPLFHSSRAMVQAGTSGLHRFACLMPLGKRLTTANGKCTGTKFS